MKKINIVVLDHSVCTVTIYENVDIAEYNVETVEEWIEVHTTHHLSNSSFMTSESEIEIIYENN